MAVKLNCGQILKTESDENDRNYDRLIFSSQISGLPAHRYENSNYEQYMS